MKSADLLVRQLRVLTWHRSTNETTKWIVRSMGESDLKVVSKQLVTDVQGPMDGGEYQMVEVRSLVNCCPSNISCRYSW